jgi:hypothetical protein
MLRPIILFSSRNTIFIGPPVDCWKLCKIAMWRRRRYRPFQSVSFPWIKGCFLSFEHAVKEIINKNKLEQ